MPIVFEQPHPFAPGVSYAFGEANAYRDAMPYLVQMRLAALNNLARGGQASAQANAAQTAAAIGQDRTNAQLALAGQRGGGPAANPYDLQQQRIQGQLAMQAQHAALQQQTERVRVTAAEKIYANKLRNSLSAIDQQLASGQIDPDTAAQLKVKVQTGLDPIEQKMKREAQQNLAEQRHQTAELRATQASGHKVFQQFMADNPEGFRRVADPKTGELQGFMSYKADGTPQFHQYKPPVQEKPPDVGKLYNDVAKSLTQTVKGPDGSSKKVEPDHDTIMDRVRGVIDAHRELRDEMANPPPPAPPMPLGRQEYESEQDFADRQEQWQNLWKKQWRQLRKQAGQGQAGDRWGPVVGKDAPPEAPTITGVADPTKAFAGRPAPPAPRQQPPDPNAGFSPEFAPFGGFQ